MNHNNDYKNTTNYQMALSDFLNSLNRFLEEARKIHPDEDCDEFTITIPEFRERIHVSIKTIDDIPNTVS